jgi:hypothetical protein
VGASSFAHQHLHHGGRVAILGFGQKKVDVFRHRDVSHDHEPIVLASLLQNREEAVAAARGAK